jgi:hypothetical protein
MEDLPSNSLMTKVNHTIFKFSNLFKVRACTIRNGICLPDWKSLFQWNQWIFTHLVGGFNHLEKYYVVNGKDYPIYYGKIYKTCSKPPTRFLRMVQTHLEITVKDPPTLRRPCEGRPSCSSEFHGSIEVICTNRKHIMGAQQYMV